jgi:hypothetical protein
MDNRHHYEYTTILKIIEDMMNVISHVLVLVYYNTVVLSKNQIIQYILCQQDSYPRGDGWETIICTCIYKIRRVVDLKTNTSEPIKIQKDRKTSFAIVKPLCSHLSSWRYKRTDCQKRKFKQ